MSHGIPPQFGELVVEAGETLIIGVYDSDPEQLKQAKAEIKKQHQGVTVVFIDGARSMAVVRPGKLGAMETKSAANG